MAAPDLTISPRLKISEVLTIGLTIGGILVGLVVWGVRQEGRINAQDLRLAAQDARSSASEKHQDEAFAEVRSDIRYIRDRIDRAVPAAAKP